MPSPSRAASRRLVRILAGVALAASLTAPLPQRAQPRGEPAPLVYEIRVVRQREDPAKDGIYGMITVQGKNLGPTIERRSTAVRAGAYAGKLRYNSGAGFALGPLPGAIASINSKGDFLVEIVGAKGRDGTPKTAVLFHNGTSPENSEGCILVGGPSKNGILPAKHPLVEMRRLFYGDLPEGNALFADVKQIHIVIVDP